MKKISLFLLSILFITSCSSDSDDQKTTIVGFENVPESVLAGPTAYGENLYPDYKGEKPALYKGYLDAASNLFFNTTTDPAAYGFGNGGIAISQWTNSTTEGFTNQCSVYSEKAVEKKGGHNGSATFAVVSVASFGEPGGYMYFKNEEENQIQHVYITNSTYAVLSMLNGDAIAKKHTYERKDWFKLTFIGHNSKGTETGRVEFYLSDFRTENAKGVVTEWTKVDLSSLGNVNKVTFELDSSDKGDYGMNTPSYFCMDDIMVVHRN